MKRYFAWIGFLLGAYLLTGCAGTPSADASISAQSSGTAAGSSGGMTLDEAIARAAAQMDARLPAKTEVALISVSSPSTVFSRYVMDGLESALVGSGKLVVVDRSNLDKVLEEQGFHLSADVSDDSAKSIGKMVGAGAIVTGNLTNIGTLHRLTIKAIDVERAVVTVSFPADITNDERVQALISQTSVAALPPSSASRQSAGSGTAQAPAAPAVSPGGTAAAPASGGQSGRSSAAAAPVVSPDATNPAPVPSTPPPASTAGRTYKIGDQGPAGGIIFFDAGLYMDGWRYLEAAPADIPGTWEWGAFGKDLSGTSTEVGSGKRNTQLILDVLKQTGERRRAAQLCQAYENNGYKDWFLPSKDELNWMYVNLKKKGLGGFTDGYYWSSSQPNTTNAWDQRFSAGYQDGGGKNSSFCVRAVRAF